MRFSKEWLEERGIKVDGDIDLSTEKASGEHSPGQDEPHPKGEAIPLDEWFVTEKGEEVQGEQGQEQEGEGQTKPKPQPKPEPKQGWFRHNREGHPHGQWSVYNGSEWEASDPPELDRANAEVTRTEEGLEGIIKPKRKRGETKPDGDPTKMVGIAVRMTLEQKERLQNYASERDQSMSSVVMDCIAFIVNNE